MSEQRYQAVLAVVSDGETVSSVAARFGVHRKTVHGWLARYEAEGLAGLADRSHRPRSCPHQTSADVEAVIATMRSSHPGWGPRRLVHELGRAGVDPVPSESAVYRALVRLNLIDPSGRRRRDRKWKRWERGLPMELWQMDVVGGFVLADGRRAKALTGIDDHSRFCVSAHLMLRESSPNVCDGLAAALRAHGVPGQILTDNGKVFTGRFNQPPVEVLFDRICRENGIEHLHTQPRSPTTTGKVERFHRALRTEFRTDRVFVDLATARPSSTSGSTTTTTTAPTRHSTWPPQRPGSCDPDPAPVTQIRPPTRAGRPAEDRPDGTWVTRRASAVGVVCVSWQQVCLGVAAAGRPIDVWVTDKVLQFYDGDQLLRTQKRESTGEVRVKRSTAPQRRSTVTTSVTDQPN